MYPICKNVIKSARSQAPTLKEPWKIRAKVFKNRILGSVAISESLDHGGTGPKMSRFQWS